MTRNDKRLLQSKQFNFIKLKFNCYLVKTHALTVKYFVLIYPI